MGDPIPYWRFFPGSVAADTMHLSAAQFGCHMRMQSHAWRRANCAVPHDPAWLAVRLNLAPGEYEMHVAPLIGDLWEVEGDDLVNHELRAERLHVEERSAKAKRAADARWGDKK